MSRIRDKLTYANVMSTVAVFVALGGSSYAALTITGRDVKNSSLTARDLKRNTLGGSRIKESRLGTVPRARNAARVGGLSASRLLVKMPGGDSADYHDLRGDRSASCRGVLHGALRVPARLARLVRPADDSRPTKSYMER